MPVIGGSTLEITGQEPNQEHTQKVPYQNKFIQAGGACVIGSEGESRKNFNTVYEEQACGAEACPGQEEEIEQCNAGDSAWWDYYTCECITSPIVIDLDGDGLSFTAVAAGVKLDLDRDGMREQLSWTRHADRDGFLALDRNRNGQIDDGGELFGSTTDQPPVRKKNGFLALAVFDRSDRGGNEDGVITQADRVFSDLRGWFDLNHDGVGQLSEQYPLDPVGITELSLSYSTVFERDRVGNVLRFVGDVKVAHRSDDPFKGRTRKAIDLFLQHGR